MLHILEVFLQYVNFFKKRFLKNLYNKFGLSLNLYLSIGSYKEIKSNPQLISYFRISKLYNFYFNNDFDFFRNCYNYIFLFQR